MCTEKSVGTQIYCCLLVAKPILRIAFRVARSTIHSTKGYRICCQTTTAAVAVAAALPACQFVWHLGRPSKNVADITVPNWQLLTRAGPAAGTPKCVPTYTYMHILRSYLV